MDLNVNYKIVKCFVEGNSQIVELSNDLYEVVINQILLKFLNILFEKKYCKENKVQIKDWEKICVNYQLYNKGFVFIIYKELLKFNSFF